jgi:hypothetical protein
MGLKGKEMTRLDPFRNQDILIAIMAGSLAWVITLALKAMFSG